MNEIGNIMFRGFILIVCLMKTSCQGNAESFRNLSRTKRQFAEHCLLPDHPANGELKILGEEQKTYSPNTSVILNTIIDLSCKSGYLTETGGLVRAICYQGDWKPTISRVGGCVKRCIPVKAKTNAMHVTCKHRNREINCDNSAEGTVLQVFCKPFYETANAVNTIRCTDGTWDRLPPSCEPVCGKKRVDVQPLIIGGATAIKAEYPWVVGVYKSSDKEFIGGATLISPSFLLSAAHIFTDPDGHLKDKNHYVIAAGKYYRVFNDRRDENMQTSRIEQIYVPDSYRGNVLNYASDFAIVKLEHSFALNEYVQPVCIDLRNAQKSSDLRDGNEGIIAGWGNTQESNFALAEELQVLTVAIKSRQTCLTPQNFEKFYTSDKLCAGNEDASVCVGDSGGGLFFRNSDSRFYIIGILSVAPRSSDGCDANSSALYTKVSPYLSDIAERI